MDRNIVIGALLGVVVGDALGLPVQFESRAERKIRPVAGMEGWGAFNMPPGSFSDDGSLTLCSAESICEAGLDPEDAAQRFLRWFNEGYWTPGGFAYDIGNSTHRAMERLSKGVPPTEAGPKEDKDNGNGSLMRILPAALYLAGAGSEVMADCIWDMSRITHGHPRACSACYIYAFMVKELLAGCSPKDAYANLCALPEDVLKVGIAESERKHFSRILNGTLHQLHEEEIKSSGYVVHTLEASFWCLLNNDDFPSTLLASVNLGEDTDTVAAVTGGLAGIVYGLEGIPREWLEALVKYNDILALANRFADKVTESSITIADRTASKQIGLRKIGSSKQARTTDSGTKQQNSHRAQSTNINSVIEMLEEILKYRNLFIECESDTDSAETDTYRGMSYSERFMAFIEALYDTQFVLDHDWMPRESWGKRYFNDLKLLQGADLLTLRLLLFAAVRNDRFCDGYLGYGMAGCQPQH